MARRDRYQVWNFSVNAPGIYDTQEKAWVKFGSRTNLIKEARELNKKSDGGARASPTKSGSSHARS